MNYLPLVALGLFALIAGLWGPLRRDRARLRTALGLLILWAAFTAFSLAAFHWISEARVAREIARAFLILSAVQTGVILLFDVALRKVKLPKFASEITIVAGYAAALFQLLFRVGVDVTGVFATSAVATAVLGLALQDMLSNIAGGIALELEGGVKPGDFIRCDNYSGWVRHIRLRHTAIRTPDGDTVILPNSHLTKSPFVILSKAHRLFIPFTMPYARNPHEISSVVQAALRASPIPDIAAEPAPVCIIQEMAPAFVKYAAVVWLSNPGNDVNPISSVLNRVYFALQRAGVPASESTYVVEMKQPDAAPQEIDPVELLRRTPIFRLLDDEDLNELGRSLKRLTFAPGEHIIVQGAPGDSMYFMVGGSVGISLRTADGSERQLARFEPGDFFGEASLLTGEPRNATATAMTGVDCYRLNKSGLQNVIARRIGLAEDMSVVVAHRQTELAVARQQLSNEAALRQQAEQEKQLLVRIRRFFGIDSTAASK